MLRKVWSGQVLSLQSDLPSTLLGSTLLGLSIPIPSTKLACLQENFNETPTEVSSSESIPSYLQGKAADTPVMMYCTGGIRCDVYSAHLRDKGFTNLYTLEGGVQNYLRQEGHEMWDGSLFVFDGRMAVPSGETGTALTCPQLTRHTRPSELDSPVTVTVSA